MTPRTFWDQAGRLWVLDEHVDFVHVVWDENWVPGAGPDGWFELSTAEAEFGPLVATC